MDEHKGYAFTLVDADNPVTIRPCVLVRLIGNCSDDAGAVILYQGRDASGRSLGRHDWPKKDDKVLELGVLCEEGVYVDIVTEATTVLVIYDPLPEP